MIKRMLRELSPPLAIRLLRSLKCRLPGFKPMYEPGVYLSPHDIPDTGAEPWDHPNWINYVREDVQKRLGNEAALMSIHEEVLLTSCLMGGNSSGVSVLDLGGAVGTYFTCIKGALSTLRVPVKYAVVDGAENCRAGSEVFADYGNIKFFEFEQEGVGKAHSFLGGVDVCFLSSTLQYILDWRSALKRTAELDPKVICFARNPTSDDATQEGFAVQNVATKYGYCGATKVVLIPYALFMKELLSLGYVCLVDQGTSGDSEWYWQSGCDRSEFRRQSIRAMIFVKKSSAKSVLNCTEV